MGFMDSYKSKLKIQLYETSMNDLCTKLDILDIPYKRRKLYNGYQINIEEIDSDVIIHEFSYGNELELFECQGDLMLTEDERMMDSVRGHLTADEVVKRIEKAINVVLLK